MVACVGARRVAWVVGAVYWLLWRCWLIVLLCGRIYWRHRAMGGASGLLGELESVLSPSYWHVVEEVHAKQIPRLDQASGDGSGAI